MAHVDRLFDPRTRLVSFLGSLALSMTCGAAILHWIEPADTTTAVRTALLASRRQELRDAVETDPPLAAGRWREILLAPLELSPGASNRTLVARPERRDFHFVVDLDGRIEPTTSWRRQQPVGAAPHVIRICLAGPNVGDLPSPEQCQSLRALLHTLGRECHIPPERVKLVDANASGEPAVESTRTHLRRSLVEAGVLG